jgi:hypothetical protein
MMNDKSMPMSRRNGTIPCPAPFLYFSTDAKHKFVTSVDIRISPNRTLSCFSCEEMSGMWIWQNEPTFVDAGYRPPTHASRLIVNTHIQLRKLC